MITSLANDLIKMVNSLKQRKGRLQENLYIAEGIHLLEEAINSGVTITKFFWTQKLLKNEEGRDLFERLSDKISGIEVSEQVFAKISETENPQGILGLIEIPSENTIDYQTIQLGLVLDGVQDPGNVGTIIRTAWAAGVDCLMLTNGAADPYQGKVVRSSMGGVFYQKIYRDLEPQTIARQAKEHGVQIIAGFPAASQCYFDVDLTVPTLILVGNEGRGVSQAWEYESIQKIHIPQPGQAESLNVSVSAGILIYEAIRQRFTKNTCKS
ncbi:MAG TPA: RNA methyltransferase [Bacillota bacterium]|nr:RNA methyltransferase [Bacillota bacterium]HOL08513.1 RNA methyltransferase [Bacillota bacterium]HPO97006.1 RNA methyltransferase [Bacillota bacterium]